ncbi:hypothetical protein OF377_02695 [Ureaplasma sp. ES3154-GEN]|uniref:hypothetical protein n=1 Tax=Ureaplasma sp. ES3154-GEN TaxID=2984844 RepID=UPI0021E8EC12|nr:hypothetical protein [Ureaplasma sp. ES3154-GEN]MCV3743771.1 hypothetical protein [Ureaplasma sp. ES3154-GEN]
MNQKIYIQMSYPELDNDKYISSLPVILEVNSMMTSKIIEFLKLKYSKQRIDLLPNITTLKINDLLLHFYVPTINQKPNIFDQKELANHIEELQYFHLKTVNTPWLFYEDEPIKTLQKILNEILVRFQDYVLFIDFWAVHMQINSWLVFATYDFKPAHVKNPNYLEDVFYTKKNDLPGYIFVMHLRAYGFLNVGFSNEFFNNNKKLIYDFIRKLVASPEDKIVALYQEWQDTHQTTRMKNKEELFLITKH